MYLWYGVNSVEVPIIIADISKLIIFYKRSTNTYKLNIFHRSLIWILIKKIEILIVYIYQCMYTKFMEMSTVRLIGWCGVSWGKIYPKEPFASSESITSPTTHFMLVARYYLYWIRYVPHNNFLVSERGSVLWGKSFS